MAMFEIGKIYKITTWADGGAKASSWTVIEHDWPLIKVAGAESKRLVVINTTSYAFVSAELENA